MVCFVGGGLWRWNFFRGCSYNVPIWSERHSHVFPMVCPKFPMYFSRVFPITPQFYPILFGHSFCQWGKWPIANKFNIPVEIGLISLSISLTLNPPKFSFYCSSYVSTWRRKKQPSSMCKPITQHRNQQTIYQTLHPTCAIASQKSSMCINIIWLQLCVAPHNHLHIFIFR